MKTLAILPLVSIAAACLGGCGFTVPPVLNYATSDSTDLWQQGLRLHPAETPGFAFTTAWLEYSYDAVPGQNGARPLIFRVAARNEWSDRALLDPTDFRLVPSDSGKPLPAIDPENVLLAAERGRLTENALHTDAAGTAALIDLPLIILGTSAYAAGGVDANTEAGRHEMEKDRRDREADAEARHEKAMREWDGIKNEWSVNALRKTTLLPGMEAQGRVAFAGAAEAPPPDTLLLQWKRPDGSYADLGRYARPPLPKPEPKARDPRQSAFAGPTAY